MIDRGDVVAKHVSEYHCRPFTPSERSARHQNRASRRYICYRDDAFLTHKETMVSRPALFMQFSTSGMTSSVRPQSCKSLGHKRYQVHSSPPQIAKHDANQRTRRINEMLSMDRLTLGSPDDQCFRRQVTENARPVTLGPFRRRPTRSW